MKKILLPIPIVLIGAAIAYGLVQSRPQVESTPPVTVAPLVRVLTTAPQTVHLDVQAQGTVLPRTQIQLTSRVAGEVRFTAKSFEAGGFFRRGDVLLRLEDRDYQLTVQRAEAQVAQNEVLLAQQEAEAALAKEEWQELGDGGEASPLTLRQPQVDQAKAALRAAEADLAKAKLDLERTRIVAPFDGRVRSKSVDLGQYVAPGSPLAVIHATDYAEIRLPVPDAELRFLELPMAFRDGGSKVGPEVMVGAEFAGRVQRWQGRIVRSEGEIDTRTRMLPLVARIDDPYGTPDDTGTASAPLAVGLFVDATVRGIERQNVTVLPRSALRDGDQVLVVDSGNQLRHRPVEVIRTLAGRVFIGQGLEAGEKVCVSPLDVVVEGMEVRVQEAETPPSVQADLNPSELMPAQDDVTDSADGEAQP